jgi:ribonuclease P protein component
VGFVAGKRVGSAVLRNRAKRRLREAVAHCELRDDTVYVLIADQSVLAEDFSTLVESIERCVGDGSVAENRT